MFQWILAYCQAFYAMNKGKTVTTFMLIYLVNHREIEITIFFLPNSDFAFVLFLLVVSKEFLLGIERGKKDTK